MCLAALHPEKLLDIKGLHLQNLFQLTHMLAKSLLANCGEMRRWSETMSSTCKETLTRLSTVEDSRVWNPGPDSTRCEWKDSTRKGAAQSPRAFRNPQNTSMKGSRAVVTYVECSDFKNSYTEVVWPVQKRLELCTKDEKLCPQFCKSAIPAAKLDGNS